MFFTVFNILYYKPRHQSDTRVLLTSYCTKEGGPVPRTLVRKLLLYDVHLHGLFSFSKYLSTQGFLFRRKREKEEVKNVVQLSFLSQRPFLSLQTSLILYIRFLRYRNNSFSQNHLIHSFVILLSYNLIPKTILA